MSCLPNKIGDLSFSRDFISSFYTGAIRNRKPASQGRDPHWLLKRNRLVVRELVTGLADAYTFVYYCLIRKGEKYNSTWL